MSHCLLVPQGPQIIDSLGRREMLSGKLFDNSSTKSSS